MQQEEIPMRIIGNNYSFSASNKQRNQTRPRVTTPDNTMDQVPLMVELDEFDDDDVDYFSEGYQTSRSVGGAKRWRKRRSKSVCRRCWWLCCGGWKTAVTRYSSQRTFKLYINLFDSLREYSFKIMCILWYFARKTKQFNIPSFELKKF